LHRFTLAMLAALAVAPVLAQDDDAKATEKDVPSKEAVLPAVSVTANKNAYRPTAATSATKTDTPLRETPQSVSVVTRERMEDMGAQGLPDALNYTAGIRSNAFGSDSKVDWLDVRGAQPDEYLDGLRQTFGFYTSTRPDAYALERI
jgi:iron complex outermembrane receptor protein